jgi:hypothetical protein
MRAPGQSSGPSLAASAVISPSGRLSASTASLKERERLEAFHQGQVEQIRAKRAELERERREQEEYEAQYKPPLWSTNGPTADERGGGRPKWNSYSRYFAFIRDAWYQEKRGLGYAASVLYGVNCAFTGTILLPGDLVATSIRGCHASEAVAAWSGRVVNVGCLPLTLALTMLVVPTVGPVAGICIGHRNRARDRSKYEYAEDARAGRIRFGIGLRKHRKGGDHNTLTGTDDMTSGGPGLPPGVSAGEMTFASDRQ